MPNRVIRDSILTSASVDGMTAEEERLFFRLLLIVDDFGRFDARPAVIRGRAFALKTDVSDDSILRWLARLAELEVVLVYDVRGKRFVCFPNWEVYQQRRAKASKWPAPSEGIVLQPQEITNTRRQMIASASKCLQPPADVPVVVVVVEDVVGDGDGDEDGGEDLPPAARMNGSALQQPSQPAAAPARPTPAIDATGQASLLPATGKPDRRRKRPEEPEDEPKASADLDRYVARWNELKKPRFPLTLTQADRIMFFQQRKARGVEELLWVLETLHGDAWSAHSTVRQLLSAEAAQKATGLNAKSMQEPAFRSNKFAQAHEQLDDVWEQPNP